MVNISDREVVDSRRAFKGAGLLLVDIQERLAPEIAETPRLLPRISALIEASRMSGLPLLATEQYSRGLGPTLPQIRALLRPEEVMEKIHFAAPREPFIQGARLERARGHWLVAGMEAHVCVLQSVLSLLAEGRAVTVISDAVASRVDLNRRLALARMTRAGARLCSSDEVCAELTMSGEMN